MNSSPGPLTVPGDPRTVLFWAVMGHTPAERILSEQFGY